MSPPRPRSWLLVGTVALVLFADYFLYGAVIPLTPHAPAGITSEHESGLLYAMYAVSVLAVTPFFGYFGDRAGPRFMMLGGAALAATATLLFGIGSSFGMLLAARFCQGAASAAVWTSGLAVVAESYRERRVEMIGYAFTGSTAGAIFGPMVAGFLDHHAGYACAFALVGVLIAIEAICIFAFVPTVTHVVQVRVDLRRLLANRGIIIATAAVTLAAFAWGIIEPLLPLQLEHRGASTETVGTMFTAAAIAYGLAAPLVGWACNRLGVTRVIQLGAVLVAATLPLLATFDHVVLVAAMLCVVNIAFAFMMNPAAAEIADATETVGLSCYATAYALYNIAYSIGMLFISAIEVGVAQALGMAGALAAVSAVLAAALLASMRWLQDRQPARLG